MNKYFGLSISLAIGSIVVLPSFGAPIQSGSTGQDVVVVNNPARPAFQDGLVLRLETEIKEAEENPIFYFARPFVITLDGQANIYVGDMKEKNIKKFDPSGRYLKTIGRPGMGPSELDGIGDIFVRGQELIAFSSAKRDFIHYDLDGHFKKTTRASAGFTQIKIDAQGRLFATKHSGSGGTELVRLDSSFQAISVISKRAFEEARFFGVALNYALAGDDRIVVGNHKSSNQFEVPVYDRDGKLIQSIRKAHKPERVPQEWVDELKKNNPVNWEIPEYFMPFQQVDATPDGHIMVCALSNINNKSKWNLDVFDKNGKYVARQVINNYYASYWTNQRLYAIERNEEGAWVVRIYRLIWKLS